MKIGVRIISSITPRYIPAFRITSDKSIPDDMLERNSVSITLHDVEISALRQLIDYTYSGEITITEDNVQVWMNCGCCDDVILFLNSKGSFAGIQSITNSFSQRSLL